MKYTIFTQFLDCTVSPAYYTSVLDNAEKLMEEGHEIDLVYCCGKSVDGCCINMYNNKISCICCNLYRKNLFHKLSKKINFISLSDYSYSIASTTSFTYHNIEDIKKLAYKHVQIGYAAFSTYLTTSRNLFPLLNNEFRSYFDKLLRICCQNTDAIQEIIKDTHPDIIACFNGRAIYSKHIIDTATYLKIPFISYETIVNQENMLKTYFYNTTPHNVDANTQMINEMWDSTTIPKNKKLEIATTFFTNRRKSIYSGDKLYVKDQILGMLPVNWDTSKRNILILNSSEDEFSSLGKEFEKNNFFPTQYNGIYNILKLFIDNDNFHFYLRIHPNLKNVTYLYHKKLYDFRNSFSNITIIPPESPISTYSLIDASEKVIVFGSTTGPESVFWNKPTILLSYCLYSKLDICYIPKTIEELKQLILSTNLPSKDKLGALKFAYYRFNKIEYQPQIFYPHHFKQIHIGKRNFQLTIFHFNFFRKWYGIILQIIGKRNYHKNNKFPIKEDQNF